MRTALHPPSCVSLPLPVADANGNIYDGQWANGDKNGQGVYKFVQKEGEYAIYRGQFKDGKKHGKGTWQPAGKTEATPGEWIDGKMVRD